jgi:hypothetical protein
MMTPRESTAVLALLAGSLITQSGEFAPPACNPELTGRVPLALPVHFTTMAAAANKSTGRASGTHQTRMDKALVFRQV